MKKGQAALEFLMTYGWAILAAIIVISVLAYFGVFSPGRYAPSAFNINAPFGPDEYRVSTAGVTFVIRNGGGENLDISKVALTNTPTGVACTDYTTVTPIDDGTTATIAIICTGLSAGDRFRADMTVTYKKRGGVLDQTSTGTVRGTATV